MIIIFIYLVLILQCSSLGVFNYSVSTINLTKGLIDFGSTWCSSYSYSSNTGVSLLEVKDLNGTVSTLSGINIATGTALMGNGTISNGSYFAINTTNSDLFVYEIQNGLLMPSYSNTQFYTDEIRFGSQYLYVLDRSNQKIYVIYLLVSTLVNKIKLGNSSYQLVGIDTDINIILLVI